MGFNRGISANNTPSIGNKPSGGASLQTEVAKIVGKMYVGRVTDIILNSKYPEIEKYGGVNSIGTIFYESVEFTSDNVNSQRAKPLFPQMSSYPLVNEIVLMFNLPNTNIGSNNTETSMYYLNMISLWNHPHHNAYPNPQTNSTPDPSQLNDYQSSGSIRRITDGTTGINLNSPNNVSQQTFPDEDVELQNIHPLLPFAGDVIYQGRWGNSIRFGSTAKPRKSDALNDWSLTGKNGDPLTIIRNGQPPLSSDEGWVPITENINTDLSSLYLTSTQAIPITTNPILLNGARYPSYTPSANETPTPPSQFTGNQVIINSGRLVFNSKEDHIMLSSKRTISFEAVTGFNFDTSANFVIQVGTTIKLGGRDATESLIKGDKFLGDLEVIMNELSVLCTELSKIKEVTIVNTKSGVPSFTKAVNGSVSAKANSLKNMIDNTLIPNISLTTGYKSNISKTK